MPGTPSRHLPLAATSASKWISRASMGKAPKLDIASTIRPLPIDAREIHFDALVAASGKCLEGVPGMGFVVMRQAALAGCAGHSQSLAMDLHDQQVYMERTGQWRFTPPTHVLVALDEAIAQHIEQGGQPARLARYQIGRAHV